MSDLRQLQEKWAPVLDHESLPNIEDSHKRGVVAQILENQEKALTEEAQVLSETVQTVGTGGFGGSATATGPVAGFDPVLIVPDPSFHAQLIAYDIAGVQPMTGPTGLIFAMRTVYGSERDATSGDFREAFFNGSNAASLVQVVQVCRTTILPLPPVQSTMLKALTLVCSTIPLLAPMR